MPITRDVESNYECLVSDFLEALKVTIANGDSRQPVRVRVKRYKKKQQDAIDYACASWSQTLDAKKQWSELGVRWLWLSRGMCLEMWGFIPGRHGISAGEDSAGAGMTPGSFDVLWNKWNSSTMEDASTYDVDGKT